MKKVLLGIATIIVCLSMAGCGNKETQENNSSSNSNTNSSVTTSSENNNSSTSTSSESDISQEEAWETLQEVAPETANDIKEDVSGLSISSSSNKYVLKQGENLTAIYYHNGEKITGYEGRVKYDNHEEAVLAKNSSDYTDEDDIESVTVEGNELVVKYKPEAYADTTLEEIKQTYEMINMIQGN